MEKETTPQTTPTVVEDISTKPVQTSKQINAEVAVALSTLDKRYKENIGAYAHEVHACTHAIEKLQNRLDILLKEKEPHSATLAIHQKDIDYTLHQLEKLSETWIQKSLVISELESEFNQLNYTKEEREVRLKDRKTSLESLDLEILNTELSLLEYALQKQNILLQIEPIEREIKRLKQSIKDKESEKRYVESAYLHKISPKVQHSEQQILIDTHVSK